MACKLIGCTPHKHGCKLLNVGVDDPPIGPPNFAETHPVSTRDRILLKMELRH